MTAVLVKSGIWESRRGSGRQKKGRVRVGRQAGYNQLDSTLGLPGAQACWSPGTWSGPWPRLSELDGNGRSLLACLSTRFPGDADTWCYCRGWGRGAHVLRTTALESPDGAQEGTSGTDLFQDPFRYLTFWFSSNNSLNLSGQQFWQHETELGILIQP